MDLRALLLQVIALLLIARVDSWFWRRRRRRGCSRVNCVWSWRSWSTCSCSGTQTRYMTIHRHPICHGTACPPKRSETRSCVPSNRKHCQTAWGGWGTCSCSGRQSRSTYVRQQPVCGGNACPAPKTESRGCVPSNRKHCEMAWRPWGTCSCSGSQSRSTFIKQEPKCGGNACPALKTETRTCVPGNRKNCVWKWSGWSVCTCGGGHTRSVIVTQQPVCGGVACPSKTKESQSCIPDNRKDCIWSWESWSSCTCDGRRARKRTITQNAECGGALCPAKLTETGSCQIPRRDCSWSWNPWSACVCPGKRTRALSIHVEPLCNGLACPTITKETGSCIPNERRDCVWLWKAWSPCNCDEKRTRTRTITQKAKCGGAACPTQLTETGNCQKPKRDCQWSWNAWSACECPGEKSRTLSIQAKPQCGGVSCPTKTTESGICIPEKRRDCKWSWKAWSTCNCDQTRERTRTIIQKAECGGVACPTQLTETGSCQKPKQDCQWSWGTWSVCECPGKKMRKPSITSEPQCGGTKCPSDLKEYVSCVPDKRRDCKWTWELWSPCNCDQTRTRERTISQKAECGGAVCPKKLTETGNCLKPRLDCKWSWNAWSVCECPGRRFRTPSILSKAQCGGVNCPLSETGSCIAANKTDCIWQWSLWSDCSCLLKRERSVVITLNDTCGGFVCPKQIPQMGNCSLGSCVNGSGACNITDGSCECIAGKTGSRCEKNCPPGTYGLSCQFNCSCDAGIRCDPTNGKCCPPRRYGVGCLKELKWFIKRVEVDVDVDDLP